MVPFPPRWMTLTLTLISRSLCNIYAYRLDALSVLCAQLMHDMLAIAKFLLSYYVEFDQRGWYTLSLFNTERLPSKRIQWITVFCRWNPFPAHSYPPNLSCILCMAPKLVNASEAHWSSFILVASHLQTRNVCTLLQWSAVISHNGQSHNLGNDKL